MRIFSRLARRQSKAKSVRRGASSAIFAAAQHTIERLESRLLLSSTTWTNAAGGNFDTSGNWNNGVPASGVDAVITMSVSNPITKTNGTTDTFASLTSTDPIVISSGTLNVTGAVSQTGSTLTFSGGTLDYSTLLLYSATVNGTGTLTNAAASTLTTEFSAINAPLVNDGTLDVLGNSSSINGGLTTGTSSTINLTANDTNNYAYLYVGTSFTNNGTIDLVNNSNNGYYPDLTITSGTLTNAAGHTITASGSGTDTSAAQIAGSVTNAGTITVPNAQGLYINDNGSTFVNTGTVSVSSGKTLTIQYGTFDENTGGTVSGGTLALENLTANLNVSLSNSTVELILTNSTVNGPGTLTNATGQTLTLQFDTINAPLVNDGTLDVLGDSSSIEGALTTGTSSTINLTASDTNAYALLYVGTSFTNNGTIDLVNNSNNGYYPELTISTGSLTNAAGHTITASGSGTDTEVAQIVGSVSNAGTITVPNAQGLYINNNGSTFTNTGTLSVTSGKTLTIQYGTFDENTGGTVSGGTLVLETLTANLNASLSNSTVTLDVTSSIVNGPGTLTNATGQTLTLQIDNINAPLVNDGTLDEIGNSSTIDGGLTTGTSSTINLTANDINAYAWLYVGTSFTNNGTIDLVNNSNNGYYPELIMTSGTLTNAAGHTIAASGSGTDAAAAAEISGSVTNQGTISVPNTQGLYVNNDGSTFTNSGTLSVGSGKTLTIQYGTFDENTGGIVSGGTLALENLTANLNASLSDSAVQLILTNSTVNGPGTLTNATSQTLTLQVDIINAPLVNDGTLDVLGNSSSIEGGLTTQTGSTINLTANDINAYAWLNVGTSFTNNGTIDLVNNSNNGYYPELIMTSGTLTNAAGHTIAASGTGTDAAAAAEISGSVTNQGTISVPNTQGLYVNNGSATFTNSGTLSVGSGKTLTIQYGTFDENTGGTVSGGGTLALENLTANLNASLSDSAAQLILTNSTVNGPGTLTNATSQTLTLQVDIINAPLVNDGTLDVLGNSSSIEGGLTTQTGSTINLTANDINAYAWLNVGTSFTNNGTIDLVNNSNNGYYPELIMSSGSLTNAAGATITTSGSGTDAAAAAAAEIDGSVLNEGTISLARLLTVADNLVEDQVTTAPILDFQVSGAPSSLGAPVLTVSGSTSLAGDLQAELTDGFAGVVNTTYTVANFASAASGSFASTAGVAPDFRATVNSTNIMLEVGTPPLITSSASQTITVGQTESFTVTASGYPASTFSETGTLPSGLSFNTSTGLLSGTPGSGTVTTYDLTFGAANGVTPNASQPFTLTVVKAATTTALTKSSTGPIRFGQSVTFTATVASTSTNTLTPTGTVTFKDGTTSLGTGTLSGGVATLATTSLTTGSHPAITAVYAGDTNFVTSTSNTLTQTVDQAGTTTTLTKSSSGPVTYGQSVTLTATLAVVSPGAGTPSGTVNFMDNGSSLGTGTVSGDVAKLTTTTLPAGSNSIDAVYSGDTNFSTSTSNTLTQTVDKAGTTTTLTKSVSSPITYGQSVTFTATLSILSPGAGTPTGTVNFMDGATLLGTGTVSSGVATLTTTTIPAGSNSIDAVYSGDPNFTTSTSGTLKQTVNQAETTTTLTKSVSSPITYGQSVTFTATLSILSPGAGTPTGTVNFMDGATLLGTGTISGGVATLTTTTIPAGSNSIDAVYSGDPNFTTSTSGTLKQTVNQAETHTTLTKSTTGPVTSGTTVTFTATLSIVSPGAGSPTGTVNFIDNGSSIGTGTVSDDVVTFTTSTLPIGSNSIDAVYSGDTNFATSTSNTLKQTVDA